VHAAGVHAGKGDGPTIPEGGSVVGFSAWREGLALRPDLGSTVTLDTIARQGLRIVNREPGAQARRLLDAECRRLGLEPGDLPGYETCAAGHLQVRLGDQNRASCRRHYQRTPPHTLTG
jgi:hypothetical protein